MTDWALSIGCNQTGLNEWKVYVAKSMYNLQPCYYSHVNSWAHWTITGMDGKRLTTKWVILFTWLLKSSSAEVTLWLSIYMEHKHLHILLSRDVYLHTSPLLQIFLSPVFQPYSSPLPDHPAKPLVITHETIQSSICHFSFQTKCATRCTAQSLPHWKDWPSPLSFRDTPEWGHRAAAAHFQVVPAYHEEPSVNHIWVLSYSQLTLGNFPWSLQCSLRKKKMLAEGCLGGSVG